MGFFDALKDAASLIGEVAGEVATTPQVQYQMGRAAGLNGQPRQLFDLGRDDGSDAWARLRDCADAYNRGYDDGRHERLNS